MKNFVLRNVTSIRFILAVLLAPLAIIAVSCKTSVVPSKAISTTTSSQPATPNLPAVEAEASKHAKASFYTCGMHPEVRSLDPDGKCPICQMPLLPAENVMVVDPATGKTNNAASYPAISGYYSCPMHPTTLSRDPDGKCPACQMPLLPVENPVFIQDK